MKGKLIKLGEDKYDLLVDFDPKVIEGYELSITNCQVIERGYDLDELDNKYCTHEPKNAKELRDVSLVKLGFRDGFQKALEVNADKRFTLKEMVDCWNRALEFQTHKETLGEYIKSLKQTEWEVEIEMEEKYESDGIEIISFSKPKLDENGCLILKQKP